MMEKAERALAGVKVSRERMMELHDAQMQNVHAMEAELAKVMEETKDIDVKEMEPRVDHTAEFEQMNKDLAELLK